MSHTLHTTEPQHTQTKEFQVVTVTDTLPRSFYARHQRSERANPAGTPNESSLSAFHEEFRSLVLADHHSSLEDPSAATYVELFEPHELEFADVPERVTSYYNPVAPPVTTKAVAPQQAVRPMPGPRVGTPVPIEAWVVKVILGLVGLNLLFASLIVAGVRLSDLFK